MTTKSDLERLGLFREMEYHHGSPYVPQMECPFNEGVHHGKQMEVSGNKVRDGTGAGYFSPFKRLWEGEGIDDPMQRHRRERKAATAKQISPQLFQYLSYPGKMKYGLGSYFGTFSGNISAFSPGKRDEPKTLNLPNFSIKPSKKGSGYQYPDIALNPYPAYTSSDYNAALQAYRAGIAPDKDLVPFLAANCPGYFNENPWSSNEKPIKIRPTKPVKVTLEFPLFRPVNPGKKLGGMKDGCFTPFSEYAQPTVPIEKKQPSKIPLYNGPFRSTGEKKSTTFVSVIQRNVKKSINVNNYNSMKGVVYN